MATVRETGQRVIDSRPRNVQRASLTEPETLVSSAGHVTWDEYRVKFLASKGLNEKEVAEKIKNSEDLKLDEESE